MSLYLKCHRGVSMCHVQKLSPTEENPDTCVRKGSIMLLAGVSYLLVEVPSPFDPEAGAPWLALADPKKHFPDEDIDKDDLIGLNKHSLVFGPRSICQIVEVNHPSTSNRQTPALLR